jgi:hypothetical protein
MQNIPDKEIFFFAKYLKIKNVTYFQKKNIVCSLKLSIEFLVTVTFIVDLNVSAIKRTYHGNTSFLEINGGQMCCGQTYWF